MSALLATLVPALGWALLDFLWQGLLIGVFVLPLLGLLRNARPQARYALLLLALLACICLPTLAVLQSFDHAGTMATAPTQGFIAPQWLDDAGSAPAQAWQAQWQAQLTWLVAAWSLGASSLALRLALGFSWIARTRNNGVPPGFEWQARLERLSAAMGLSGPPALRIVQGLDSPAAAGWWRPTVLLPAALLANMPADLLEALLAHELAHIKRHDYLVNLMQGLVEALLFYHPVVWWLSRQIRIEREQIADDLATRAIGQARPLALALQHLERMQAGIDHPFPNPQLAPAAHGGHLMNRIKRLLRPTPSGLHWKSGLSLIAVSALCVAVYAQASTHAAPATSPAPRAALPLHSVAMPAPAAAPSAVAAVAALAPAAAIAPVSAVDAVEPPDTVAPVAPVAPVEPGFELEGDAIRLRQGDNQDAYALVRNGRESVMISGNDSDRAELRQVRTQVDGDYLWFRHDGKSFVVNDPSLVAQAMQAWAPAEAMGAKMQALGDQMQPHSAQMEALSRKMQALAEQDLPQRQKMEAASRQMEPLAQRQQALAERMRDLSLRMTAANTDIDRDRLQRDLDRLQLQLEPLNKQMAEIGESMGDQARQMETARLPMKQLSEQMRQSSEPMKALSEKLNVLAKQQEALSHQADDQVKHVIEQAMREGKAEPRGSRQAR